MSPACACVALDHPRRTAARDRILALPSLANAATATAAAARALAVAMVRALTSRTPVTSMATVRANDSAAVILAAFVSWRARAVGAMGAQR